MNLVDERTFAATVAERAGLSKEEARDLTRATLEELAGQLSSGELRKLVPMLPDWLRSDIPRHERPAHPIAASEFIHRLARRTGLKEEEVRCLGTYNNFAQTDTSLYDLHCYLMYLKFGFGRCTQDVGIDIRRGALTRKQALALVRRYDGEYPEPYVPQYLEYFRMSEVEFDESLDRWANRELFEKVDGRWKQMFEPE